MLRTHVRSVLAFLACFFAFAAAAWEMPMRVEASVSQPDGKVLLAGHDGPNMFVVRLNADGTRDMLGCCGYAWFNPGSYSFSVRAIALLGDGRIMVAATRDNQVALIRLAADGTVDASFGAATPGMVTDGQTPGLFVNAIVPLPDGSLLGFGGVPIYGNSWDPPYPAVVRYLADGSRDMAFGNNGVVGDPMLWGQFNAAVVTPDGAIAAAGWLGGGSQMVSVARFATDGTLQAGFGNGGWATFDLSLENSYEEATAIALDAAGRLVVAGRAANGPEIYQYGRLLGLRLSAATGTMVDSFLRDVPVPGYPASSTHAVATGVLPLADGDYVVGGTVWTMGYSRIFLTRAVSGAMKLLPYTTPSPYDMGAGVHAAPNGELVFLATAGNGPSYSRRSRHFTDNLDFDTDLADEGTSYDVEPNPFAIEPVAGAAPATVVVSAPFRIAGINQPAFANASGGEVSVGCVEPWAPYGVMVSNGQWLCARVTTAPVAGVTTSATVTVGQQQAVFSVSTVGPPETTITTYPPAQSGAYAVIYYQGDTASGPVTGYECRVDADPFTACPYNNHVQVGPLAVGPHTFEVRALNAYGADPTPALASWTVVAPPQTTITSGPAAVTNATTATFTFESSLPDSRFMCNFNHPSAYEACTSPKTYTVLQSGTNLFRVYAFREDSDPSPAEYSFVVDVTPPDTAMARITPSYTYQATSSFSVSSPTDGNATFQCSLDGGAWYACGGPTVSVTVAAGSHTLAVRAVDAAGNVDPTPDSKTWTYNDTPLDTAITSGPSGTTSSREASFTYTATQLYATFGCSLAGPGSNGAIDTCAAAGRSYSFLPDGTWTFRVWAISEGVQDPTPAERTWIVDTVAPSIALSSPGVTVNSRDATLQFAANESGVTFACSLDGAAEAPCTSPRTVTGLADGYHTFSVAGTDLAGNRGSAIVMWQVDATGPDTTITSGPGGAVAVRDAQFAFTSNESGATFQCRLDGAAWSACTSPASFSALPDGAHAFEVRATDAAGNVDPSPAVASWTVDTSAPDTAIDSGPSGTVSQTGAAFTFHASEPSATFECSLDSAAFSACSSGISYAGIGDGMHLFEVRARDALGNTDATPASRTWSVDSTQPGTTITSGPAAIGTTSSATFTFTATEVSTFMCSLDAAAFSPCTSPVSYALLAAGSHAFAVYAIDAVGNADASPATWSWIVDNVPPDTAITGGPSGNNNPPTVTFTFTSTEAGSSFECQLDGGAWSACASPITYSNLANGKQHTFQVRAIDAAGNVDPTPATRTWR